MISETRFARSYSSVWRGLTPTLELFVRKVNLRLSDRFWVPLASVTPPGRRALINQVAFQALKNAANERIGFEDMMSWVNDSEKIEAAELELTGWSNLDYRDILETKELAHRMGVNLFRRQPSPVTLSPNYSGCGIINSCYGDAISERLRFIELKDGDRPFRSYEFRQLIVYCALHMNEGSGVAGEIQVINSRRGVEIVISFEDFCNEVAGQTPVELLSEVVRVISDPTIYQG